MRTAHGPRTAHSPRVAYSVQTACKQRANSVQTACKQRWMPGMPRLCITRSHRTGRTTASYCQLLPEAEAEAEAAKAVLEQEALTVVADAGHSNLTQFQACDDAGITAYVPPNRAVNNQGDGT